MGKWTCDEDNCPGVVIVLNKIWKSVLNLQNLDILTSAPGLSTS